MSARANAAIVVVAFAFGIGGLAASRWLFKPAPPAKSAMVSGDVIGRPYVDVALPDLDGRSRRLSEFAGRPMLLNFWATWCAPCVREMPLLDRYAREHPELSVVGIALDSAEAVAPFVKRLGIGYPILLESPAAGDASVRYGNLRGVLPFSVFVDRGGVVRKAEPGDFAKPEELDRFVSESNAR